MTAGLPRDPAGAIHPHENMEVRIMQTKSEKKKSSYREPLILIAFVVIGAILGIALGEKASVLYPIG